MVNNKGYSALLSSPIAQYTALVILVIALFGTLSFFISGIILEATIAEQEPFVDRLLTSWWDVVQTFMLLLTTLGPIYFAAVMERRRRAQQGDFQNRVLVSLNCVHVKGDGVVEFYMRSLSENSFAEVFADDVVQEIVLNAKKENKDSPIYPLMQIGKNYADFKRLRDHIKNRLSAIYVPGFMVQDVGAPCVEQEYTWALTYEHSEPRDDLNDKFRILLIRSDLLDRMHSKDFTKDEIQTRERLYDPNQERYYRERWETLQEMQTQRPQAINNRIMMGTIKFTVPGTSQARGWQSWPAKPEGFEPLK